MSTSTTKVFSLKKRSIGHLLCGCCAARSGPTEENAEYKPAVDQMHTAKLVITQPKVGLCSPIPSAFTYRVFLLDSGDGPAAASENKKAQAADMQSGRRTTSSTTVSESAVGSATVSELMHQLSEKQTGAASHANAHNSHPGIARESIERMRLQPPQAEDALKLPLLHVAPTGSISIMLRDEVIVEVAVDKAIRVLCPGKFSAASNARGTASCIMHPQARIFQEDTRVFSQLGDEKLAVFGSQGVLFTMKRLNQAYLVSSSTIRGTTAIPLSCLTFPALDADFSLSLFYLQSQMGEQYVPACEGIVRKAHYEQRDDGTLTININGIYIRQDPRGTVEVISRPRFIRLSAVNGTITVRTHYVDMGVQEDEKSFVKRGVKRLHVSRSGMVVSDGNCITSMDHYGRIVSST